MKKAMKAKSDELSEMQIRKDKAEKRLNDATRDGEMVSPCRSTARNLFAVIESKLVLQHASQEFFYTNSSCFLSLFFEMIGGTIVLRYLLGWDLHHGSFTIIISTKSQQVLQFQ